jgi:transposase
MSKHYSQDVKDLAVKQLHERFYDNYVEASKDLGISTHALRMWSGYYKPQPTGNYADIHTKSKVVEDIMHGYSYKEVSANYRVPIGTIATWVHTASTQGLATKPNLVSLITD